MKNFDSWNDLKKMLEQRKRVFFYEREIWFAHLGLNLGDEQDGRHAKFHRPVIILRKFNQNFFLAVPLTSRSKEGRYYFSFDLNGSKSVAIVSQIRALDAKRLIRRIGKLSVLQFVKLESAITSSVLKKRRPRRGASGSSLG